ncbi:perforin-1 isoform X2 [Erinaceus europaeus]|nr:perforin-1 isoform X2 [Erinaceus europaeus]XP_060058438.1 perforin-1 isoform X2 [Erinaceus europaeus]
MAALLLLSGIFLLLLLPTAAPSHCYLAKKEECRDHQQFVPGSWLAGEGLNVITLQRSGSFPVDTQRYLNRDGSCTLCFNDLQQGTLQRLPLALINWRAQATGCQRKTVKAQVSSKDEVAKDVANSVNNDWRLGLDLGKLVNTANPVSVQLSVAGSDSKIAKFANEKASQDQYVFTSDKIECLFYSSHLVHDPPLQLDFRKAVHSLPPYYNSYSQWKYERIISNYGTHIIRSMQLGGRITTVTALRTCELALKGLKANEVAQCLGIELNIGGKGSHSAEFKHCEELKQQLQMGSSFHHDYQERYTEIIGGNHSFMHELLFSEQTEVDQFKIWANTLPYSPGIVQYTLEPLHVLLKKGDPRRKTLRKAVSKYILSRTHWKDCSQPCATGQYKKPNNPCECACYGSPVSTQDCCPRQRGLAHLVVMNFVARDLWGDPSNPTDAYLKIKYGNQELRVGIVWNNDNPKWMTEVDFGNVMLPSGGALTVEVWDADDGWNDDLLGMCERTPMSGTHEVKCILDHGELRFFYHIQCLPHLAGPSCTDYAPSQSPQAPPMNHSVIYKV